ncbi:MAG: hypothetical protein PHE89_06440 [Alphaproteobacteria bacterium]|nr:hypothetical protein [Alphaproteobacteria bacterium]
MKKTIGKRSYSPCYLLQKKVPEWRYKILLLKDIIKGLDKQMTKLLYTIQPNKYCCSRLKLIKDFQSVLKKYYRKTLGPRYYKHKDKQYPMFIYLSNGDDGKITHPHFHIIINDIDVEKTGEFHFHMYREMKKLYPSLTSDMQDLPTVEDEVNAHKYSADQSQSLFIHKDLYGMITSIN